MRIRLPRRLRRLFWSKNTIEVVYQGWENGNKTVVVSFKSGCKRIFIKKFKYWFLANTHRKANPSEVQGIVKALELLRDHGRKTKKGLIYVKR